MNLNKWISPTLQFDQENVESKENMSFSKIERTINQQTRAPKILKDYAQYINTLKATLPYEASALKL